MTITEAMEPMIRIRPARTIIGPAFTALAYYLGAEIAFAIGTLTQQFAPFWPPNVVLLTALLLAPRRRWPWYVAAAFPAHLLAEWGVAMPLSQLVGAFASNVMVALLSASILRRLPAAQSWLGSLRNAALYIVLVVGAAPAAVALFAGLEPVFAGAVLAEYWQFWWRWFLANALGNLTLTPIFLAWFWDGSRLPWPSLDRRRMIEAGLLAVGLVVSCAMAFDAPRLLRVEPAFPALLYLPVPFLLAAAARFGPRGASGAMLIVTVALVFRSMHGNSGFAGTPPAPSVLSVQLFLAVMAIPLILLAALVEELRQTIIARAAAESTAQATRELLQSSLDRLTAQIAILDSEGRILAVNAAWRQMADLLARQGEDYRVGSNYLDETSRLRATRKPLTDGLRRLARGEVDEFRHEYASDFLEDRFFQMRGTRFASGGEFLLVVAHEDVTEVKISENALRYLTGRVLKLQDDERRRIARELHDSTAQHLLGAVLGIGQALRISPRLNVNAKAALEESRSLIDQAQREIRTLSYLLHPPMLDEAGLSAALRWLCEGFARHTGMRVDFDAPSGVERLPGDIEAALFRIAQEALTNARRHSGSEVVRIALAADTGGHAVLTIEDDGRGMPREVADPSLARPSQRARAVGIGISGMRERLHQFGGQLTIRTGADGTALRASVPIPGPTPSLGHPAAGEAPQSTETPSGTRDGIRVRSGDYVPHSAQARRSS